MSNKSKNLVGKKIIDNYGRSGIITEIHNTGLLGVNADSWVKDQEDKRVREHHTPESIWVSIKIDTGGTALAPLALSEVI